MKTITATELARNLRQVLDRLAAEGGEIVVERNRRQVARITGVASHQTALEAMADLYRTLPEDAAIDWQGESRADSARNDINTGVRDPWVS